MTPTFEVVTIIDAFKSFIWTERYSEEGDFELYVPANTLSISQLQQGNYVWIKESKTMMVVEEIKITTDAEDGNYLTVTGRSLSSILRRRIVWGLVVIDGDLDNSVKKLVTDAIISPDVNSRKIDLFTYKATTDSRIKAMKVNKEATGTELYELIVEICKMNNIGFRVNFTDENKFEFELYMGMDRSYKQFSNPYIVFSPSFENLVNSSYDADSKELKTVTLVAGEGEGSERKMLTVEGDEKNPKTGIERRELFTDARDLSTKDGDTTLTDAQYNEKLKERGLEKLKENSATTIFEGQAETLNTFVYGKDFFLGDIVQIENEFGIESTVRITEIIRSYDDSGYSVYPTFEAIEEEGESE